MTHITCRLTAKNRDQLRSPEPCARLSSVGYVYPGTKYPSYAGDWAQVRMYTSQELGWTRVRKTTCFPTGTFTSHEFATPVCRAGFTPSGASVQKKNVGPLIYEYAVTPSMTPARHTKSFPLFRNHYFNISGLLPCCKKMKKKIVLLWGPLFGQTC